MAIKPENAYIQKIHRNLSPEVFHYKTNNPYHAGAPDVYYAGKAGDLWVEYKWLPKAKEAIPLNKMVTALQQEFLRELEDRNRPCAVIVGSPAGGLVFTHYAWEAPIDEDKPLAWGTVQEIANWIKEQVS